MTYLREIAKRIQARIPPSLVPRDNPTLLFDLYAALALSHGTNTTGRDVHDAWVVWMLARGKRHRAMVPYEALPEEIRDADEPFADAIRDVAAGLGQT